MSDEATRRAAERLTAQPGSMTISDPPADPNTVQLSARSKTRLRRPRKR